MRGFAYPIWQIVLITVACSIIIFGTIIGNILVCIAVSIVKKLRTPSNLLIVSLAVSDLLVALLVMPFAVSQEVMGRWVLGKTFCDAWTSLDVLLCTASILNLCMISVDRYFVITRPFQYAMKRTPSRMALMIVAVWLGSALISIPPLLGWKTDSSSGYCSVSQDMGYQFYATIGAFYFPLTVMIVIYYRIYMVSSRIAQAEAKSKPAGDCSGGVYTSGGSTPMRKDSHVSSFDHRVDEENHNFPNGAIRKQRDDSTQSMIPKKEHKYFAAFHKKSRLNRISSSKERKATKTLGVIMGAFTACWLPFFILAVIKPVCYHVPDWLSSLFLWLGYANSFLNPIIYARFNRDFRTPFKEILLCRCLGINRRLRSESYAEQYGVGTAGTLRDCIRPPVDTVVRYHSQGQTIVKLGNGETPTNDGTATGNLPPAKL
ncbi:hypothetical protein CAPTEDRAFT_138863 [Capitella teleta]|uniref:G-protein coupled receptors family 1 profile domain-containing protein n=1 Tax=Capitella teleta TaxID=283909 RepID=R7VGU5_CAPTE|nr:hypothetical protein CAPTEDRAFT_138863 [Capitella teleta]|eukprot:ELU14915.1 hypothetical protein CAPTEDRAFT_138863 [Capitella teleta]